MALDPKLQKFSTASPVIASYSFQELLSSQGFLKLYLLDTRNSVEGGTVLTENASTYGDTSFIGQTDGLEVDFDSSKLEISRTMEGKATINLFGEMNVGTSGTTEFLIKIRKWDGSTETDIAEITTGQKSVGAGITNTKFAVQMDIPQTRFSIGDQIRVSITPTFAVVGGGSSRLHTDPIDRSGTPANSNINLPFNVDI